MMGMPIISTCWYFFTIELGKKDWAFVHSFLFFSHHLCCIVKERQSVAALLGDYSSDSESEEDSPQGSGPAGKGQALQKEEKKEACVSGPAERAPPEPDDYCPFFPTSGQETNRPESVIKEKVEALYEKFRALEGRPNANQELVAQEKIRFETRLSDWKEGGIGDEFFIKKLESHERALNLRFMDKIATENLPAKRKDDEEDDDGDSSPPKKKFSAIIESKPVLYKAEEPSSFDPLNFVHPDRKEYVLSSMEKASGTTEQQKKRSQKEIMQAGTISASYSSHTDKLIDKWANLRKEEERMEAEKNSLEGIERERTKEIREWMAAQINSGASSSNPNFVPLGRRK